MSINLVVLLSIVTEWPGGSTSECGEKIQVRASAVSFMTAAAIRSLGHGLAAVLHCAHLYCLWPSVGR